MRLPLDADRLKHALPRAFSVLMPLDGPLSVDHVAAIFDVFSRLGGGASTQDDVKRQWASLTERVDTPWEAIEPVFADPPGQDPDWGMKRRRSAQSFENVSLRRGYRVFRCHDVEWLVDLFNPNSELGIDYAGAGEPVVSLLFKPAVRAGGPFPSSFIEVVTGVDAALSPAAVVGCASVAGVMFAYRDGRMPRDVSPWRLLHSLTVVRRSECLVSDTELAQTFSIVTSAPRDRMLLQLDSTFGPEHRVARCRAAARLVGRVAADEVLEGRYPASFLPASDTADGVVWPTPVRDDDTAPTSMELMGAANGGFVRQAVYQVKAADALQSRGHTIRALQVPFVSDRVRITIPVVLDREPKIDACVYTQCEPWTPVRIADLRAWIAELRVDSDSPVIVVASQHSAEVAALPDVEEFLVVAA